MVDPVIVRRLKAYAARLERQAAGARAVAALLTDERPNKEDARYIRCGLELLKLWAVESDKCAVCEPCAAARKSFAVNAARCREAWIVAEARWRDLLHEEAANAESC